MNGWDVTEWAVAVAAFLTALGIIWQKLIRPIAEAVHRIENSLSYVESELRFNGGTTARDALGRLEKSLAATDSRLRLIEKHLDLHPPTGDD